MRRFTKQFSEVLLIRPTVKAGSYFSWMQFYAKPITAVTVTDVINFVFAFAIAWRMKRPSYCMYVDAILQMNVHICMTERWWYFERAVKPWQPRFQQLSVLNPHVKQQRRHRLKGTLGSSQKKVTHRYICWDIYTCTRKINSQNVFKFTNPTLKKKGTFHFCDIWPFLFQEANVISRFPGSNW